MTNNLFEYISGKSLMQRWNIGAIEMEQLCNRLIKVYSIRRSPERYTQSSDEGGEYKVYEVGTDVIEGVNPAICPTTIEGIESAIFLTKDVEKMEELYPELVKESLTGKEARELGELRRKKDIPDETLQAAVAIGRWMETLEYRLTQKRLKDFLQKEYPNIEGKTINQKLWRAIPQEKKNDGTGNPNQPMI